MDETTGAARATRVVDLNSLECQSLFGSQRQRTWSICQASSPQIAAEASALWLPPVDNANFAAPACAARRFFESGAHTTRHDTQQSTGIEQELRMVSSTTASRLSTWSKLVQWDSDRVARSAKAGTQIETARAHVAPRAQQIGRMTDLRWASGRRRVAHAARFTRSQCRGAVDVRRV